MFFSHVLAADAEVKAADVVNPVNTAWTLIAAFLVFGMQVGFTMLEAGFCRSRETVNVLMECIVDTCLCGILFYAIRLLRSCSATATASSVITGSSCKERRQPMKARASRSWPFWLFQFAFADTCSTITSGAMIGRTGFVGDLLYSVAVSGFIYPIIGHWAWGPDGFLATMGSSGLLPVHLWESASMISRDRRWCTPLADSSRWPAPSFSVRAWDADSSATAAAPCCRTI